MAEERIPDIVIPIRAELHDKGFNEVFKYIGELGSAKGFKELQKNIDAIDRSFADMTGNFTLSAKGIKSAFDSVAKSISDVRKSQNDFKNKTDSLPSAYNQYILGKQKAKLTLSKAQEKFKAGKISKEEAQLALKTYEVEIEKLENKFIGKINEIQNAFGKIESGVAKASEKYQNLIALQDDYLYKQDVKSADEKAKEQERVAKEAERIAKEVAKAQAQAEKEATAAAKQAAQEQIEEKKRVKKAYEDLGNTFKKLPQSFSKGIRTFAATLYVLRRITNSIKQAFKQISNLIDASSSWVENLNLLEVVFGDVSEGAQETKKWVSDLARTFSMDKNAIVQNVAMFKQMANAMGQAADVGERMSEVLVQLGLDISSLRNVKTETAMNDLASAIAGQIKPVRKYGFDISLQSINAMLKETGIGGSVTNLSQSDKQLARTILLLRQSTDAWGDLGKTINTFANQQRVMNDQFETTKRLLGQVFIGTFQFGDSFDKASETAGIATKIIWRVNSVLIAFNEILEAILPSAESVNGGIATMAEDAQDEIEDMNDALDNSLASFDKFNVMTSGSSSAFGNNATLEGIFNEEALKYLEDFKERSKEIVSYSRILADDLLKKFFPEFEEWSKKNEGTFSDWVKSSEDIKLGLLDWIAPITNFTNIIEKAVDDALVDIPAILKASADLLVVVLQVIKLIVEPIITITNLLGPEGIVTSLKVILGTLILIKALKLIGGAVIGIKNIITSLKVIGASIIKNAVAPINIVNGKIATTMSLSQQLMWITAGFTVLLGGVSIFATSLDQLNGSAKVLIPTLSVVLGLLTAVVGAIVTIRSGGDIVGGLIKTAAFAAAVTGISLGVGTMIAKSVNKHADGGYQTGGLFYAGENGAEWVGRQGKTSTIVNDKQMSDIMQQSVAAGVIQGNRMSGGGRASGDGKVAVVNLDGKRLFEVVQQNGKKVGKVFAEA